MTTRLLVGDDVLVALQDIRAVLRRIEDVLTVSPDESLLFSYPRSGGLRATPAGTVSVNLRTGRVERADGSEQLSSSLATYNKDYARSAFMFFDSDVDIEILRKGQSSGQLRVHQNSLLSLSAILLDGLRITADYPYNMQLFFSTLPTPPGELREPVSFQERYGEVTTTNWFTPVKMGPTGGGVLRDAYLKGEIFVGYIGDKVLAVNNGGSNNTDLNLQLLLIDGKTWVDDPVTGSSLTLASGNAALIESGLPCKFFRLRVRSSTAGSPTSLTVQYLGSTGIR